MNCNNRNIKDLLPAYHRQKLDASERNLVEKHCASCEDCRTEISLLGIMREDPVPDPGGTFWSEMPDRVYRAVQEQMSQKKTYLFSPGGWFVLPRWAWTATAAAVILLVSWFLVSPFPPQEEDAGVIAEAYDHGYGSTHDPIVTHPSTDVSDLSASEIDTVAVWATRELSLIASEAEPALLNDLEPTEELDELNTEELERMAKMLKEYDEEA